MTIKCNKCGAIFSGNTERVSGCLCDPDSPCWIAITTEGRLLKMSHADYEEIK